MDWSTRRHALTASAHIHAPPRHGGAAGRPADDERWQIDLPNDPVAAAEYLRGMERAKAIELEAIRRLRQRIEGDRVGPGLHRGHVAALLAAAFVLAGLCALWLSPPGDGTEAAGGAAHAAHAAAGSGLAISLADGAPSASRDGADAGETVFVLRNEREVDVSASIAPAAGTDEATRTSPPVAPGERLEWPVTLDAGRYELRTVLDGVPTEDATVLTVR